MDFIRLTAVLVFFAAASSLPAASAAPTVEVLHWWTTVGNHDREAGASLKAAFEKAGGRWIDLPVSPSDTETTTQKLFLAGKMPSVVTISSEDVRKWGEKGALADISDVALAENWDKLVPAFVANSIKYQGRTVAIPIGMHRVNFMLANASVLKKSGVEAAPGWPRNWEEFNAAAEKIKKAGFIPLAVGPPWMETVLFQSVVLGIGGPSFYQKAFIDLDPEALSSPLMARVFDQMRRLQGYTDKNRAGRTKSREATAMLAGGEAGMEIAGDLVKMELFAAGKKPGVDFLCLDSPGGAESIIVSYGMIAFFKSPSQDAASGQKLLARVVMSREAQERYSVIKRTIPVGLDVPTDHLDSCTRKNVRDYRTAAHSGHILANMGTHAAAGALIDVVHKHFNSDMSSEEALKMLAQIARNAQ